MELTWTAWAQTHLLPLPGEEWAPVIDLPAAEKRLAKAGAVVPAKPTMTEETARAIALRVHERYGIDGNNPKDHHGRDLVDVWVARAGVGFAFDVAVAACSATRRDGKAYALRIDGQPWPRLREHLAAAPADVRTAAKTRAAKARTATSELRQAMAFTFSDPAWVKEDLEGMIADGYGQLALLASVPDAKTGRLMLSRLIGEGPDPDEYVAAYQIVEHGYPYLPTLMRRLDPADGELVVKAARIAWSKAVRKPWLEIVGCLQTPAAKAYLAEFAGAAKPKAAQPKAAQPKAAKPKAAQPKAKPKKTKPSKPKTKTS